MKLRTKFALVLIAITLVLSGATFGGLELYKDQQVNRVQSDVDETADQTARQVDAEIGKKTDYVALVAQQPAARNDSRSEEVLRGMLENSRFFAAQLVDENGTVRDVRGPYGAERRRELIGSGATDDPCVNDTLTTGDVCVRDPLYIESSDRYVTVVTAPILDSEGNLTGVLSGGIAINSLTFFPMLAPLETSSQAVVVTSDDAVLHEPEAEFDSVIDARATVGRTGWTVRVVRDRGPLEEQLRQLALAQGFGLFVVLGAVVGFGYWEYSVNLRQAERLLSGFGHLQEGEYDVDVTLDSGEEWEQISDGFNDLSDGLAEREAALREREQRLEVLNRVMRHNVRNEMVVILNYAELVGDFVDDEQVAEMADTIYDTGQKLTGLSNKARQIEKAMESDDPRPIDLASVARDVAGDVESDFDVPVSVEVEADGPDAAAVSALPAIRRAVENVVENAAKHNDSDDPRVEITVTPVADNLRLRVADNGPGIPDQERAVLDKGRETALEHGSGLGLWLVKWVVDRSDGDLDIEDREGGGAVVAMDLPSVAVDDADVVEEPTVGDDEE